jgi:hypothetical protein
MDSLIHYNSADIVRVLSQFSARCNGSVVFTFAPRTPALSAMHAAGKLFPSLTAHRPSSRWAKTAAQVDRRVRA